MAFPPNFLDELRARVSLAGVVGRRVKLVKKGREFHGLCPFHNEKTPSFTVNEDKGFFHCFGCGAHGDAIAFTMRTGHLQFTEAIEALAAEAGMEVPKATPAERRQAARRASLQDALEAACAYYHRQLTTSSGREGLAYLRNRGLSDATIARFRLGWAPDGREGLKSALMTETVPEALLAEAGLLKKPEGGGTSFDMFRARVMFPITDRRGSVIGFGARTLGDAQPKYLNSPETPVFHKGATLYGLDHARERAASLGQIVAVEGYMDVIALHQAGFDYAVAPLGTALTEAQIDQLWRLADEPILCFDGDSAGARAMARAAERAMPMLKPGKSLRFAVLPAGDDPDSLIKSRGSAAMQAVLDAAEPLIEVFWRVHAQGKAADTPERRAGLEKDLREKVAAIADMGVRRQYEDAVRERLYHMRSRTFAARGNGQLRKTMAGQKGVSPLRGADGRLLGAGRPLPPAPSRVPAERQMLCLLISHPSLVEDVAERLGEMTFSDSMLDNLRRGILKHLDTAHALDEGGYCAHLRANGFSPVLDTLLDTDEYRLSRPKAVHEARLLWENIFTLYARKELQADAGRATETFAREPSEANFQYQAAVLSSCVRSLEYEDEDGAPPGSLSQTKSS